MNQDVDEVLELSNLLFRSFLEMDEVAFSFVLMDVIRRIMGVGPYQIGLNGRILVLVHGLLHQIHHGEADAVLRHEILILNNCLDESNSARKTQALAEDILSFLATLRVDRPEVSLSEQVLSYIKKSADDELRRMTAQALGDHFGYHPNYLRQKFMKEQGYSLHKAIGCEKFNRALRLLSLPDRPTVKMVANRLGFSTSTYFSRLFKVRFGVFPSRVHRRLGSGDSGTPESSLGRLGSDAGHKVC